MKQDAITDVFGPAEVSEVDRDTSILEEISRSIDIASVSEQRPGNTLSYDEKKQMLEALREYERRLDYGGHLTKIFLDDGPFSYDKYDKHLKFFAAGEQHRERVFMAANRIGKTQAGAYELACHLTGHYPHWWTGRRFFGPIKAWAAGKTGQTTRDVPQEALMGVKGMYGTGLLSEDVILEVRMRPGLPDAIDTVKVKHASGKISVLGFKSYDQGIDSFVGTSRHVIWMDEEGKPGFEKIYDECRIRTMQLTDDPRGGIIYLTFTPLNGWTRFVTEFNKNADMGEKLEHDE